MAPTHVDTSPVRSHMYDLCATIPTRPIARTQVRKKLLAWKDNLAHPTCAHRCKRDMPHARDNSHMCRWLSAGPVTYIYTTKLHMASPGDPARPTCATHTLFVCSASCLCIQSLSKSFWTYFLTFLSSTRFPRLLQLFHEIEVLNRGRISTQN